MTDKTLYLIRGLPGSGKTTFANSLGCAVVSADDFMVDDEGNYTWNPDNLRECHRKCLSTVWSWMGLDQRNRIAVANTFTREKEIQPYIDLAEVFGYTVHRVVIENHHGNKSIHDVNEKTMENMKNRFSIQL